MKRRRSLRRNWSKVGLAAGVFLMLGAAFIAYIFSGLPDQASLAGAVVKQSTKIYDRTGETLLYELHGGERRTVVPFDQIPDIIKKATLAAEDANFYKHPAFDLRSIARAIFGKVLHPGERAQGASTITQQLARNSFLTTERTVTRKIRELILAIRLERIYTKDEILGLYLNQIPYGSNAYGIEAASQTFFAKSAKDLNLAEAALLASLPKAPSRLSPFGNHTDELRSRQLWVLERMVKLGFISADAAARAKKEPLQFAQQFTGIKAPHFVMYVKELLAEKYGEEMVESGGLKVITTLDWKLQQIAEDAVAKGAAANDTNWQAGNAALVSTDTKTGQVLAMVGGRGSFLDDPKPEGCQPGINCKFEPYVNAALRVRQPGSSFKPFVYLTAFKKGYTPDTVIFDVPTEFAPNNPKCPAEVDFSNDYKDCYHPQNYDGKFRGPVTMRQAIAQSLNVPSVEVLYLAGVKDSVETAQAFGITTLNEPPDHYGLSLVLGGGGVKLLEMVNAYAGFAQDGMWHNPNPILRVEDAQGQVLEEYRDKSKRVFEPQYVRILNDVLSDDSARVPVYQPNGPLTLPGRPVAAKTGTSQDYRDAWTIGYTPSLAAGVWVGNNDNSEMVKGGAGVMAAAPIWHEFMARALEGTPAESFTKPEPIYAAKPILRGDYAPIIGGRPEIHSTLYWLSKNDPAGAQPVNPAADPQFVNWEASVQRWLVQANVSALPNLTRPFTPPVLPDVPNITITEPADRTHLGADDVRITAKVEAKNALSAVQFFWNNELITDFEPTPDNLYSVYFVPSDWRPSNEIKVQAKDSAGNVGSAMVTVFQ